MSAVPALPLLLLEPDQMMRRTVALTARTLGIGDVHEASSPAAARRLLAQHRYQGALLALDVHEGGYHHYDVELLDAWRERYPEGDLRVAVILRSCSKALLEEWRARQVRDVTLKPFRARVLLDALRALGA